MGRQGGARPRGPAANRIAGATCARSPHPTHGVRASSGGWRPSRCSLAWSPSPSPRHRRRSVASSVPSPTQAASATFSWTAATPDVGYQIVRYEGGLDGRVADLGPAAGSAERSLDSRDATPSASGRSRSRCPSSTLSPRSSSPRSPPGPSDRWRWSSTAPARRSRSPSARRVRTAPTAGTAAPFGSTGRCSDCGRRGHRIMPARRDGLVPGHRPEADGAGHRPGR